jgi:acyl carrier protein
VPEPNRTVVDAVQRLLSRKNIDTAVTLDAELSELGLESLDLAELSAILEDELGRDPYSEGVLPRTVGDVIEWYNA